jgi:hypothetical protein
LEEVFADLEQEKQEEQQPQQSTSQARIEAILSQYEKKVQQEEYAPQDEEVYDTSNQIVGEDGTIAIPNKRTEAFEYETNSVDYEDFFSTIRSKETDEETPIAESQPKKTANSVAGRDLKTRLYAEGFKLRPYSRASTSEYYSFNFIQSNVINRDTWLIMMAIFAVEMAIFWVSLYKIIPYSYFLPILVVGVALCLIPFIICFINPSKRSRANYNFKISILNRSMFFVELTVFMALIGFFAIGANVNDIKSILMSIIIPSVIFLNLPISSIVYYLLYRTKKYHVA